MGYTKIRDGKRPCITCGEEKPLDQFYRYPYTTRQGKPSVRYESRCRSCAQARRRARYAENPERDRETGQRWKAANRAYLAAYYANRQRTDPIYRGQKAACQRRRKAKLRARTTADDTPAIKAIYRAARELQDATGIPFHVDHKIPLKHGGTHTIDNLQILTAEENMKKGARLDRSALPGDGDA